MSKGHFLRLSTASKAGPLTKLQIFSKNMNWTLKEAILENICFVSKCQHFFCLMLKRHLLRFLMDSKMGPKTIF